VTPVYRSDCNHDPIHPPRSVIKYKPAKIPVTGNNERLYLNAATDKPRQTIRKTDDNNFSAIADGSSALPTYKYTATINNMKMIYRPFTYDTLNFAFLLSLLWHSRQPKAESLPLWADFSFLSFLIFLKLLKFFNFLTLQSNLKRQDHTGLNNATCIKTPSLLNFHSEFL
jgi:hypothetical protein